MISLLFSVREIGGLKEELEREKIMVEQVSSQDLFIKWDARYSVSSSAYVLNWFILQLNHEKDELQNMAELEKSSGKKMVGPLLLQALQCRHTIVLADIFYLGYEIHVLMSYPLGTYLLHIM